MPDFTSVSIPRPKDWQAFERGARLLFEHALSDPAVQNNGRSGQRQYGVDIFGRRGGGGGPVVGIQCKGKDGNFRRAVTEAELKEEVEKTRKFQPKLDEFILITTAQDDAKIQRAARLLGEELRSKGRTLSISVWGWERFEQEIVRYPEAIRHFHPDAQPFTTEVLNSQRQINDRLQRESVKTDRIEQMVAALTARAGIPTIVPDLAPDQNTLEIHVNAEIDGYRDLIRADQPKTAIRLLEALRTRYWDKASGRVRFRILSNIGAAHHRLGEHQIAADFFLNAAPHDSDSPASLANRICALLIKGRAGEAHDLALEAFARHPTDKDIALQRIQAHGPGETIDDAWAVLAEKLRGHPDLIAHRVATLRQDGEARWHDLTAAAFQLHPDHAGIRLLHIDDVIDRVTDSGAVGVRRPNVPDESDVRQTAQELGRLWQSSLGHETPPQPIFAHNAAMLWTILGDLDTAEKLIEELYAKDLEREETRRLAVILYRRRGKEEQAIRVADALQDIPQNRILQADLRSRSAPAEARERLSERYAFDNETDIIAAVLIVCDSYIAERDYAGAEKEIARFSGILRDHPQVALARYRLGRARGQSDASKNLDEAVRQVGAGTDFPTRFFVSEALSEAGRFNEVVTLLSDVTATSYDSPALRTLVAACVNSDRRSGLSRLLAEIPAEVLARPFYRTARIALAIRAGDIREAVRHIRDYLRVRPRDLQLQLQLMQGLFRLNDLGELRNEVARPASEFDGSPAEVIALAQFKNDFGEAAEARALAYAVLLAHPHDPMVSMGYVQMFLRRDPSPGEVLAPEKVGEGCAVRIAREDRAKAIYVIEPDAGLRPTPEYLAPDRPIAQLLLGHAVSDPITLPDGTAAELEWIKPKTLHALHSIMENFNNLFPEVKGFERVLIGKEEPLGGLDPILEHVKQRHDAISGMMQQYDAGTLPLALFAAATGADLVDALSGLVANGHVIKSCDGNEQERSAAWRAISDNQARGCVVDAVTLHIIRRLRLEEAITAVCGPIGIVDATRLRLQQKAYDIEDHIDQRDMSLFYRDGQYFRIEVTPEDKRVELDLLKRDLGWLETVTTVLPATGVTDPGEEWRAIAARFGTGFLDEIRAAETADRMLLCEDRLLRVLAEAKFSVRTSWLQPVLMRAAERKLMKSEAYLDAVVGLIDCRLDFVSVSSDLFIQSLQAADGHALPPHFEKLASRLGGRNADLPSHMGAAVNAAAQFWMDNGLSPTLRAGAVGRLLESLCRERPIETARQILLRFFTMFRRDERFVAYLSDWMRGHFMSFEN
jgi:tetratricopeptide (TPR) repeat protein